MDGEGRESTRAKAKAELEVFTTIVQVAKFMLESIWTTEHKYMLYFTFDTVLKNEKWSAEFVLKSNLLSDEWPCCPINWTRGPLDFRKDSFIRSKFTQPC